MRAAVVAVMGGGVVIGIVYTLDYHHELLITITLPMEPCQLNPRRRVTDGMFFSWKRKYRQMSDAPRSAAERIGPDSHPTEAKKPNDPARPSQVPGFVTAVAITFPCTIGLPVNNSLAESRRFRQ